MTEAVPVPPGVDPTTPSPARLYDYYLGGTNNYEADRTAAEKLRANLPDLADAAWANRGFHQRAARWMAREHRIRQFIDIGAGLPTQENTHDAVRKEVPDARVVYVDNDPVAAAHATMLLPDADDTTLITADLRDPDGVLRHAGLRGLIDFGEPTGLLATAVLHFVADESDPCELVRRYADALAPGSYLALSHATADWLPPRSVWAIYDTYANATERIHLRPQEEFERFFRRLELVAPHQGAEPMVTYVGAWGAEDPRAADTEVSRILYCGVARRP